MSATFRLTAVKGLMGTFSGENPNWQILQHKRIRLNLDGAFKETSAAYFRGQIEPQESYRRDRNRLFLKGTYLRVFNAMQHEQRAPEVLKRVFFEMKGQVPGTDQMLQMTILEVMEAMLIGGWIVSAE